MKTKYTYIYVHNLLQGVYFNFLFWYNFKLTEKLQEAFKECPYAFYSDQSIPNILTYLLCFSFYTNIFKTLTVGCGHLALWQHCTSVFYNNKDNLLITVIKFRNFNINILLSNFQFTFQFQQSFWHRSLFGVSTFKLDNCISIHRM